MKSKKMKNRNEKERIKNKLVYLGLNINYKFFIYMRYISSFILFIFLLLGVDYGYVVAPVVTIIYYLSIEYIVLDREISDRCKELELDALDYFPVLLINLKSTGNIKKSIILSNDVVNNALSIEFKKILNDVNIGKSMEEVFDLFVDRCPSELLCNMVLYLIDYNKTGNEISDSINLEIEYIKDKKRKDVIANYKVIPFKIAIVSIIFVFLLLLVLILFSNYL